MSDRTKPSGQIPLELRAALTFPSKCLIRMTSLENEGVERPLFLVHSADGTCSMLEGLVRYLDCTVYGLQCARDVPLSSIRDMATFYIQQIRSVQPVGPYRLAGYSYGAIVATEMALQLEHRGYGANLLVLDGMVNIPPEVYQRMAQAVFTSYCAGLVGLYQPFTNLGAIEKMLLPLTWSEKIERCVEMVRGNVDDANVLIEHGEALNAIHSRQDMLTAYVIPSDAKLPGRLVLVVAEKGLMKKSKTSKCYGFDNIFALENIRMLEVPGNHATFLEGDERNKKLGAFINTAFLQCKL